MKLVRHGEPGLERPGMLHEGLLRDLSAVVADITPATLASGLIERLRGIDPASLPQVPGTPRLGAPLSHTGKFLAIGLNYRDHALEAGMPLPEEPVLFMKAASCLSGPTDPVVRPRGSTRLDYEVELGVVIGRRAHLVSEAEALAHVAGYLIVNDISERAWQLKRGGQWTKGKSADSFGPIGPWLVSTDEVPDPQALFLQLDLNGAPRQRGTTSDMVCGVAKLVSYLSGFMTLHPGDIITTGTPAGVGSTRKPPEYLQPGDLMTLRISGLGEQSLPVVQEP